MLGGPCGTSKVVRAAALLASLAAVIGGSFADGAASAETSVCSNVDRFQLEKQMNFRASRILAMCGRAENGAPRSQFSSLASLRAASPNVYGGADKDLIGSGEGIFPHVTQSGGQIAANGNTLIAAYTDSRGITGSPLCLGGASRSTDNGATWTNIHPFCFGRDNYGSPALVYDVQHSKWVATFLASGCGAGGIASWSSTDNGVTWSTSCAHSGSSDDRQSMAVDRPQTLMCPWYVVISLPRIGISASGQSVICAW